MFASNARRATAGRLQLMADMDEFFRRCDDRHSGDWQAFELWRDLGQAERCALLLLRVRWTWFSHGLSTDIPQNINNTYINQSSYWLTYFPYAWRSRLHIVRLLTRTNPRLGYVVSWFCSISHSCSTSPSSSSKLSK